MSKPKREVVVTSVACRFPESGGWSLSELNNYLVRGSWVEKNFLELCIDDSYYILKGHFSCYDVDKLMNDFDIELLGKDSWCETKNMTTKEVLIDRNGHV